MKIVRETKVEEPTKVDMGPPTVQTQVQEMVITKPTITRPWDVPELPKKQKKGLINKLGLWIYKGPIGIYLLLTTLYAYVAGGVFQQLLSNPLAFYGILGLHIIILILFVLLCLATRGNHDTNN